MGKVRKMNSSLKKDKRNMSLEKDVFDATDEYINVRGLITLENSMMMIWLRILKLSMHYEFNLVV